MANYICITCGLQYPDTGHQAPAHCLICDDDRQYVRQTGQEWITLPELQKNHHNRIEEVDANLTGGTTPGFAIGQRALLVQTPKGNVLWDCVKFHPL